MNGPVPAGWLPKSSLPYFSMEVGLAMVGRPGEAPSASCSMKKALRADSVNTTVLSSVAFTSFRLK